MGRMIDLAKCPPFFLSFFCLFLYNIATDGITIATWKKTGKGSCSSLRTLSPLACARLLRLFYAEPSPRRQFFIENFHE